MLQVNERHHFEHLTEGLDSISHNTATRGSNMLAIFFVYVKWLYYPYSNAAIAEVYKIDGDQASEKKDFIEAVRLYKDALNVQCKDDSLNTELKKGEQKTSRL